MAGVGGRGRRWRGGVKEWGKGGEEREGEEEGMEKKWRGNRRGSRGGGGGGGGGGQVEMEEEEEESWRGRGGWEESDVIVHVNVTCTPVIITFIRGSVFCEFDTLTGNNKCCVMVSDL